MVQDIGPGNEYEAQSAILLFISIIISAATTMPLHFY
jgi:hypothetical protein